MKKVLIPLIVFTLFACFPAFAKATRVPDLGQPRQLPSMISSFESSAQVKGEAIIEADYIAAQNEKLELYFKKSSEVNYQLIDTHTQSHATPIDSERSLYLYHATNLMPGVLYQFKIRLLDTVGSEIVSRENTVTTPTCDLRIDNGTPRHITDEATLHLYGCGFGNNFLAPYGGETNLYFVKNNNEQIVNASGPVDWSDKHVAFKLDPSLHQRLGRGNITMRLEMTYNGMDGQRHVFSTVNYNGLSEFLQNAGQVGRTVESGYQAQEYLYLYNALAFRYGITTPRDIAAEQREAAAFRERIRVRLGRDIGVDALWFLNLFYARYYGGYSDDDIVLEVSYGPCRVHTTIPQSSWSQSTDYHRCEPGSFRP